jgi:hypothetical protein
MIKEAKEYLFGKAPILWFPDERTYIITECKAMPSAVGMEFKTKPKRNTVICVEKGPEFRLFKVVKIEDFPGGFILKTPHLEAKFLEV